MYCPYCGYKNRGKPEYCERCGRYFTAVGKETNEVCSHCKKDIPAGAKYCWHCGERFEEESEKEDVGGEVNDEQGREIGSDFEVDKSEQNYGGKEKEPIPENYEEFYFSFNPEEVTVVKSILDAGKIRYFCKGDYMSSVFAGLEPVRFYVYKLDVANAIDLMKELENMQPDTTDADDQK